MSSAVAAAGDGTVTCADLVAVMEHAAEELSGLPAPESATACQKLVERLTAAIDRAEYSMTTWIGRVDAGGQAKIAGFSSTASWLRSGCGMRGGRAAERLTLARQLPRLDETAGRLRDGDLPLGYATVIADGVSQFNDADAVAAEDLLLRRVDDGRTVKQVATYAARIHDAIQERDGTADRPRRGYARSWIKLAASADGGAYVNGWLTAEHAALWHGILEPLAKPVGADDPRDRPQRVADAIYTVFSAGGRNWSATVIIDYDVIAREGRGAREAPPAGGVLPADDPLDERMRRRRSGARPRAWLPDGTPLAPERARQIALAGGISALVLGPGGVPLYLGRSQRLVSPAQRRVLEAQYRTCSVRGCEIPATVCEIDHIVPWCAGGRTDIDQLAPKCHNHNRFKARYPDRVEERRAGCRWETTIRPP